MRLDVNAVASAGTDAVADALATCCLVTGRAVALTEGPDTIRGRLRASLGLLSGGPASTWRLTKHGSVVAASQVMGPDAPSLTLLSKVESPGSPGSIGR